MGEIDDIVKIIARNLGDYDLVAKSSASEKSENWNGTREADWNPYTLSQGLPGIILLYGKLMELEPEEETWCTLAHDYLGRTVAGLNAQGMPGLSMFSGLAGLGLCAASVSDGFSRYGKLIHTVNTGIAEQFDAYLVHVVTSQGTHSLLYDAIEGASGILSYLSLFLQENQCYEAVRRGLRTLTELTGDIQILRHAVPGWYIPAEHQFSELEQKIYPQGNFNTSLSHGIAGPLVILSKMFAAGVAVEGQREAIEKIVDFYFQFRCNDGKRDFWKGQLDFAEVTEGKLSEENIVRRDAWCYGSPGICYALMTAGEALGKPEWVQYAVTNLKQTMQDIRGIFSPTFCHGYAGLYQILNSAEALLKQGLFSQEKAFLKEKILNFYDQGRVFGFPDMEFDHAKAGLCARDAAGLLGGAAGVCLVLLEGEHPGKNVWKKAFLLDEIH